MTIEIHQPELEAMIQQRMASGAFPSVEDVLRHALETAPQPTKPSSSPPKRTGLDLLDVMQAMPYRDEVNIEPSRPHMPVRNVSL